MALTNTQIVTNDYNDILFDSANNAANITLYAGLMTANPTLYTPAYVAAAIANPTYSPEASIVNYVYSLYSSVLGVNLSNSTVPGLQYWVQQAEALMTPAQVLSGNLTQTAINFLDQSFINAGNSAGTLPSTNAPLLVAQMYANGLGNSSPTAAGVAYWVNQYTAWVSTLGASQALISLINSFANAAAVTNQVGISAVLSAAALTDTGSGATYGSFSASGSTPATFQLTTGQDVQTANVFNAVLTASPTSPSTATLQGFDSLTGTSGGTANTLTIIDGTTVTLSSTSSGDTLPAGLVLSNIPKINLTTSNNAGANTIGGGGNTHAVVFDTSLTNGVTSLNVISYGAGGDDIKAALTTDIAETYNSTGGLAAAGSQDQILIKGGNNVFVTDNGSYAGVLVGGGTAATDARGNVTVIENGGNVNATTAAVTVQGGVNVTVTDKATGAIYIGTVVSPTGVVTVTDTGGTGDITVTGGASATITDTATTLSAVTVSAVTAATTINASGIATAVMTLDGGTTATINTTGGFVTIGATTAPTGVITVNDTRDYIGSNDAFVWAKATGALNLTTTATSGAVTLGSTTKANDTTGNVTVINQTVTPSATYYGSSVTDIFTNGATSVSVTGGGAATSVDNTHGIVDEATTNVLATVSLTGFGVSGGAGTIEVTSTALSALNISNSTTKQPNNAAAAAATVVTVNNTTADHTLAIGLNGDTNTGVAVVDNTAKVINVTASGTTANNLTLTDTDTPAVGGKTLSFTNNSTGTLSVQNITNTNGTTAITVSGTGAVTFVNAASVLPTSITDTGSGAFTGTIDAQNTNFTGGSGANVITLSSSGAVTKAINGGSGTNNTLIGTGLVGTLASAFGGSISGFQNFELKGGSVSSVPGTPAGYYYGGSFTNLLASGLTQVQVGAAAGNSVTFSSVAAGTGLTVLDQALTSSATFTEAFGAAGDTFSLTIDGKAHTFTAGVNLAADTAAINLYYGTTAPIQGVTVTDTLGAIVITGAATTAFIALTGTTTVTATNTLSGVVTDNLATAPAAATGNTLPLTLNSAAGLLVANTVIQEAGNQTISINSVKNAMNSQNTVVILDSSTAANANQATTLTISGAGKLTVTYGMDGTAGTAADALAIINASTSSGSVNVSGVVGKTTGMTITGGTGALTAFGSGLATGESIASYVGATDLITTGSGGGTITLGYGGAGLNSGSETLVLSASTAKADTINIGADTTDGVRATVSGFTSSTSSTVADVVHFTYTEVLKANVTTATATAGSDTYTMANGYITFSGPDSTAQMVLDARAIVDTGASNIAAFSDGTDTYVVTSGSGTQGATNDTVLKLSGVTGKTGFAADVAGTALVSTNSIAVTSTIDQTNATAASVAETANHLATDDTGFAVQGITGSTVGTFTESFINLANSATINSTVTGGGTFNLSTGQIGTAGTASLQLNLNSATNQIITTGTFLGDGALTINATTTGGGGTDTITTLVDSGNTLAKISITGTQAVTIGAITDTALTSISISDLAAVSLGGTTTPITQAGLTVTSSTPAIPADAIYLSGASDVIDASAATSTSAGNPVLSATGAGSTIKGGLGAETIIGGANATVTMLQGSTDANGTTHNGNASINTITVGANSTVTLGTAAAGTASDGGSTVDVHGDTAGTTSSGAYNLVTVANASHTNSTVINFYSAVTTENVAAGLINVASAASLSAALDMAVANTGDNASGHHSYDWFQYAGNDYVVAHTGTGAAVTGLTANDLVVKVVGLVDFAGHFTAGGTAGVVL